ncbi:DUF3040 domain-containing protein [Nakamurella sp.]|uniref:DUF3040 domain-containing protein n=1 Tax=Nakamurella sp. TaxID=1869182 RepID=UPI003B3A6EBA
MSLSEDEKSRLDEIAAHALATDPDFVLRLRATAARHPSTRPAEAPGGAIGPAPTGHPSRPTEHRPHPADWYNRRLITLSCLLFVGVSLLSNGWTAAQGLISLGALVAVSGAGLTSWTAVQLLRLRRAYRTRPA